MTRQEIVEAAKSIVRQIPIDNSESALALARAVLAREDDSPITSEWLEARGGVKIHLGWRFGNAFVVADSSPRYLSLIDHDGMLAIVVGPATRRHVLLAMELFGIEPK